MKQPVLLLLLALVPLAAFAGYEQKYMVPWLGATQDELVAKWGYPQSANDIVKIDDKTTVYTYRSFRGGFGGPQHCVISFTMKDEVVTRYKYEGGNCPGYKR